VNKKIILLLILIIFASQFAVLNVKAQESGLIPPEELLQEGVPIVQQKGNLAVTWILVKQAPFILNISIQNLIRKKTRQINLTAIIDNCSFSIDKLRVEAFYEWKNVSYTVQVPDYGTVLMNYTFVDVQNITQLSPPVNVTMGNPNGPNYAEVITSNETVIIGYSNYVEARNGIWNAIFYWEALGVVGYHNETRYRMDWKPCKMQMIKRAAKEFRANMGLIKLPPYGSKPKDGTYNGTKWFRLIFKTPMSLHVKGRVALDIDGFAFDPWFDSSWQYRKSHEIVGSTAGAVTDYQIRITVHYGSGTDSGEDVYVGTKCRADFGDIRFTKADGETLLDYWLENEETAEADGYGVFWVEVDSIPASPDTTTIYIYYGNPSATTTSNGDDTFLFFDHFEGTSLDLTKWIVRQGDVSVANSELKLTGGEATRGEIDSLTAFSIGAALHTRVRWSTVQAYNQHFCSMRKSNDWNYRGGDLFGDKYDNRVWFYVMDAGSYSHTYYEPISTPTSYHIYKVTWRSGESKAYQDDTLLATLTTNVPTVEQVVVFQEGIASGQDVYVDWVFVRKYVDPEPSHGAWGSEESALIQRNANQDLIINAVPSRETSYYRTVSHQLSILAVATRLSGFARTVTQIIQFVTSALKTIFMFRTANQQLTILTGVSRQFAYNRPVSQPLNVLMSVTRFGSYHRDAYQRLSLLISASRQTAYSRVTNQQLKIITESARYSLYSRSALQPLTILTETTSAKVIIRQASQTLTILTDVARQISLSRTVSQTLRILVTATRQASYHRTADLILRIQTAYSMKFIVYIEKPVPTPTPAPATVLPQVRLDAIIQTAHIINTWWTRAFTIEVLVINKGTIASDVTFEYQLLDSNNQIVAKGTQTVFISGLDKKTVYVQIPKPPDGNYTMIVRTLQPVRVEARSTITVETPFYGRLSLTILLLLLFIAVMAYAIKRKR